ncbi:MAG: alginate export family protein [Bryobacterales bacterium]|nr:alginate export family protein [Bryobacterales bacterium]
MRIAWRGIWAILLAAGPLDADGGLRPLEMLNGELPRWMRFDGEYRARFEDQENMLWRGANSDRYLLNRVRFGMTLRPREWMTFYGQAQDARVFFPRKFTHGPPLQDTLDLRQAWVQLGNEDKFPLQLRVGRQELVFGEERMVGASNWSNIARTFQAVKLTLRAERLGGLKLDTFASTVVVPREGAWDGSLPGDNLHGAYAVFDRLLGQGTVEPYFYWRLSPAARKDTGSLGLRVTKSFGPRWYASSDTVLQRGSLGARSVGAWATYWRVRRTLGERRWKPAATADVNLSSGDRDPSDGRFQTFDVLYPTPHDKYGLADQVGWKNIRHFGGFLEVTPRRNWTLQAKFHTWWLESARDALYAPGGALVLRDSSGLSGRHVGEEIDFQFLWKPAKDTEVSGGAGHMLAGEFLKKMTPGRSYTFYYLSLTRRL